MTPNHALFHPVKSTQNHPSSPFLYIRLSNSLHILFGTSAYTADPTLAKILATSSVPPPNLLHLILQLPTTTATLLHPPAKLTLQTPDNSGLHLQISLPLHPSPPEPLLNDLHLSLFAAVAGLEATLLHHTNETHDPSEQSHVDCLSLEDLRLRAAPLSVRGARIDASATFRAAVADFQHGRALRRAAEAFVARTQVLEARDRRIEALSQRRLREKRLVREAKRAVEEKGRGRSSLFADEGGEQEGEKGGADGMGMALLQTAVRPRKKRKKLRSLVG